MGLLLVLLSAVQGAEATTAGGPAAGMEDALLQVSALQQANQPEAALQRAQDALRSEPLHPGLRFARAVLLGTLGRRAEASTALEQLTQDYPELPEPYNNLAVLRAETGALDEARALLETALRLDPTYRTAHENLGGVLLRLALRSYEAALQNAPRLDPELLRTVQQLRALNSTLATPATARGATPTPKAGTLP